jgi:hypothetical protein
VPHLATGDNCCVSRLGTRITGSSVLRLLFEVFGDLKHTSDSSVFTFSEEKANSGIFGDVFC